MLPISGRALPDIHGNVQHTALHHAHQLALRVRRPLEMQAPQHAAAAPTQIVLHKTYLQARLLGKFPRVKALHEVPAGIAKCLGLNNKYARDGGFNYVNHALQSPLTGTVRTDF